MFAASREPAFPIRDLLLHTLSNGWIRLEIGQRRGRLRRCCQSRAPRRTRAAIRPSARHCPARRSDIAKSSRRCARNPASRRCCRHSRRWRGRTHRADADRPRRAPCRTAPARPSARGASGSVRPSRYCRSRSRRDAAPRAHRARDRHRRRRRTGSSRHSMTSTSRRGVGRDAQPQRIARVLVHDLDRRHAGRQQPQRVVLVALDLGPEPVRAGDDKPEVADLRDIDPRVIDLVDDAEAEREP